MPQLGLLIWCVRVTAIVVLLLSSSVVEGGELHVWRSVLVSYSRVTSPSTTVQMNPLLPSGSSPTIYCSITCTRLGWCNLWCAHPSTTPTHCIISNIIVMPTYQEPNMADALTCHTGRPKDLATNAIIKSAGKHSDFPERIKDNLVDGIYSYSMDEQFLSQEPDSKNWFTLEFHQVVTFTHVTLYAQPNKNARVRFVNVEIRVGNVTVTPPSGFKTYDLFGVFPGAASKGQVVDIQSTKPVSARFISVQKKGDSSGGLALGHVEVY